MFIFFKSNISVEREGIKLLQAFLFILPTSVWRVFIPNKWKSKFEMIIIIHCALKISVGSLKPSSYSINCFYYMDLTYR